MILHIAQAGDLGPGDVQSLAKARMDTIRTKSHSRTSIERANGLSLEVVISALPTGGVIALVTDVTERNHRDRQLQTHLTELEEFNKLAVGRELRMIELKEEINQLLDEKGTAARYEVPQ